MYIYLFSSMICWSFSVVSHFYCNYAPSPHQLQFTNVGEIPANFSLVPSNSQYSSSFTFTPSSGVLAAGQNTLIQIHFQANAIGEIDEDFGFAIDDVPSPLRLRVHGRVVGPRLHFSQEAIDFSITAFGFVATRTTTLVNDCEVSKGWRPGSCLICQA